MTTLAPPRPDAGASGSDPLLALACPACHAALAAPRATAGTAARCPVCQQAFLVPLPPRRAQAARERRAHTAAADHDAGPVRSAREEKAIRRTRRNLLMLFSGVTILLAIVLLFGSRRPKKQR
jgi:hypothetical protein